MRSRSTLSQDRDGKNALIALVIVLLLVVSSVGAFLFFTAESRAAQKGDTVKVDYIGRLADGRVFDTSIYSVAADNATYPKSLSFTFRGNETVYRPYEFVLGSQGTLAGFSDGIVGMKKGETRTIVIPAGEGYKLNESKLTILQLTESVPVQRTMSISDFEDYFSATPAGFMLYTDPIYGWNVQVLFVDGENVRILNNIPVGGAEFRAYGSSSDPSYGWQINATYDSTGDNITVHHQLDSSSAFNKKGLDYNGSEIYVESVDEANGTAIINHDKEVAGKELTFTVTLVSIG
ncbi:MAG: FKBP-type peptidyl-prolyl cis-trans isomerase [Methanomassiliicoccales archaeon PtaU1.Bin030]|nr:MAG: FKBP-type peptidyl-prolyl cis-trans isomerase [Methanomassiliicoccales archaeon PtaU1.Bin030]